jgi:hypothetical protein
MGGHKKPGPIGTDTNQPQIDAGTMHPTQSQPPGSVGASQGVQMPRLGPDAASVPVVKVQPGGQPLTLDELWNLVQSQRGFEASASPFKKERDDRLRSSPATVKVDPRARGAPLGDPVETFAGIQIIDKDGRLLAIGSDHFDKGPLRGAEADKLDKHAEARVLRALEKAVPGEVPDGSLVGLVDQEVCPACRAKLEAFARQKKLRLLLMHVPERPKLQSGPGMASPKQTSRTSLQDLTDRAGSPIKITYRESVKQLLREPEPVMPRPSAGRLRMGEVGATIGEALVLLLLDLLAAKVREKLDQRQFAQRMRELEPQIGQRKLEAYKAAGASGKTQEPQYYNIEIRVTTTSMMGGTGGFGVSIPGSAHPEVQSVKISAQPLNSAGPVEETAKVMRGAPMVQVQQIQVLTYSEPVVPR